MKHRIITPTTILAIESSFDDTAVAVVVNGTHVLSSVLASQIPIHQRYGGVVPEIAARAHVEHIGAMIEHAVSKAFGPGDPRELIKERIDYLAVTVNPGLLGSLLVGVSAAQTLALSLNKPLIPVNHIVGHIYSNFLVLSQKIEVKGQKLKVKSAEYQFPFLTLVASGGHTQLILSTSHHDHRIISQTRDDAAGEAFDKAAQLLGLEYPGGPSVSVAAQSGDPTRYTLPRGLSKSDTLDFSFSGLKTALLQLTEQLKKDGVDIVLETPHLAASFQEAVVDSLVQKTVLALKHHPVKQLFLAGGVAANKALRAALERAAKDQNVPFSVPDYQYCTDNAAMVGAAAYASTLVKDQFSWYDVTVERGVVLPINLTQKDLHA